MIAASMEEMSTSSTNKSETYKNRWADVDLPQTYRDLSILEKTAFRDFLRTRLPTQHHVRFPMLLKLPLEAKKIIFDRVSLLLCIRYYL
jgi:hypothetical protein